MGFSTTSSERAARFFITTSPTIIGIELRVLLVLHRKITAHTGLACSLTVMGTVNANVEP